MLTVRATKTPPRITLLGGRANFSLLVAIDVYVVCNQTTPSALEGEVDPACDATMPLALTMDVVGLCYAFHLLWILQMGKFSQSIICESDHFILSLTV